jgi:DNA-binding NarL/FixJ family response regulator
MKILIADNHQMMCDGLRLLLERQPDFQVIGEATDGRAAVRMTAEFGPDVVVMDVVMPELNGIDATLQIRQEHPRTRVVALSMHSDRSYVVGMLAAGASGYVLKDCAFAELADAVRRAAQGQIYLSARITGLVLDDYIHRLACAHPEEVPAAPLSPREREVLQLLAEGHPPRTIAKRLHLSVKTVESHRRHIMEKLHLGSLAELTKYAIRTGITSLD